MSIKRIIPCLDIRNGSVVIGQNFEGVKEVADPIEMAEFYNMSSADELVIYDITASLEGRTVFTELLNRITQGISVPVTVGGGVNSVQDFEQMLKCGVKKVSINSGAVKNPNLIKEVSREFGSEKVVFAMDVKRVDGKFEVFTAGGRNQTGLDALDWVKKAEQDGAGEVVVNSIDTDGVKKGFDTEMLKAVADVVRLPIVASGGAGSMQDFLDIFLAVPAVSAALAASVFHYKEIEIEQLKDFLAENGISTEN